MIVAKPKRVRETRFSDFIRNASAKQKKRVYSDVLERASERQRAVMAMAKDQKK
ncbi:MAG TPA: hypothetical protein VKA76_08100 [Gammaproteobacteria bacterium]|nr:hypothetical protein [Gammaproteobacteria bacterium]